ncbi:hypothetical protein GJAV_G00142410 [Gymnothorax javanicus]|nr:hypothetical protein GJAV_G00142410 [Gymnothorax javanicus]
MDYRWQFWPISVLVLVVGLSKQRGAYTCSCTGESDPPTPVLSGPALAFRRRHIVFRCEVREAPRVGTYQLVKNSGEQLVTVQTVEGQHPANFSLMVRPDSGGIYHCRVRKGGQSNSFSPLSNGHSFQVVTPVRGAFLVPDPASAVVWEGQRLALRCQVRVGTHLSYRWYFNRTELPHPSTPPEGQTLVIDPVSEQHAGRYYCIVGNALEDSSYSSSLELEVRVKVFLSEPQISFSVTKEERGYRADVRCWSVRGSPPVRFRLVIGRRTWANQTAESLSVVFSLPVRIGRSQGLAKCIASNYGNQELISRPLKLEVVPVGGTVQMQEEYLYSADSEAVGVSLRCTVSRGTFPEFAWFQNHTPLPPEGEDSYIITREGHTLILPIITARNSGYYHCQARDSFDSNSTWILSPATPVHKSDQRLVSSEIIAVTFCCFLLLVLMGSVYWIFTLSKTEAENRLRRRSSVIPAAVINDRGVA